MPAYISGTHHSEYDNCKAVKMEKEAFSLASVKQQADALKNNEAKIFRKTIGNLKEAKQLVANNARYIPFIEYTIIFKKDNDAYIVTQHAIYLDL